MLRPFFTIILLTCLSIISGNAKIWIDVTNDYIKNPDYDNNNFSYWQGTGLGAANPHENAEHYQKTYNTYQKLTGLKPGKYRLSLRAFYRMGSSSNDYNIFISGDAEANKFAQLYATSDIKDYYVKIKCSCEGMTTEYLGGNVSTVGNWWSGQYYIPNNMEAAYYWFTAGYYKNSVECEVGSKGTLTIGIRKDTYVYEDWTCIDSWRLEYYDDVIPVSSITLSESSLNMVTTETRQLSATVLPDDATYKTPSWTTSNASVATVNADGIVTAKALGTAIITATAADDSGAKASCTITVTSPASPTKDNIVINEIMAANIDEYRDPSTNFGSWVELYNPSDKGVKLGGLYVTDDTQNLKKHKLGADYGVLGAHGFAILNFDHFENFTTLSYRQIDDKLDCDGGIIYVTDGATIIAEQDYPSAISRTSYARMTDGSGDWGVTAMPTPGMSNTGSTFASQQLEKPTVTKPGQLFGNSITFKVNIPSGATLRYTTDGTTPTLTNGKTSNTGVFYVYNTTCYRFRLFQDGYLPSPVATHSYIQNSGNEPFPIISLVVPDGYIFNDETAIFSQSSYGRPGNGQSSKCNWNMSWDRPVNFEYITTDNECVVNQECDFSACGGWSRAWSPHSFKLKASKNFDKQNTFNYQFFPQKPFLRHKTLQIRNGGNDTSCRIKDAALQEIVGRSGLYIERQSWQPVHVFINGSPYAVLNMREPNNKHYGYSNYGIDTDLMDQFEICPDSGYVQMTGTKDSFNRLYQLAKNAAVDSVYQEICKLVDIDEYINYMATEFYLGGTDWPQNNIKGFRDQYDGKFRFVLFDLDGTFATSTPISTFLGKQNYTFDYLYGYDYSKNKSITGTHITKENEFVTIFKNMLKNMTFRRQFIDAFCLVGGSVFTPGFAQPIIREMATYLSQGGYVNPNNTANQIINQLTLNRQSSMVSHMKNVSNLGLSKATLLKANLSSNVTEAGILVNGMQVPTGSFNGTLVAPVTLTAVAPAGYVFHGWKNQNGTIVSPDVVYELPTSGTNDIVAVWQMVNDAELAESCATPIKINEVSAGNDMYVNEYFKKDDWVELYNTTDQDIDVAGLYLSDNTDKPQKFQITAENIEGATIIPAHGHLIVWCSKRTPISQLHATFKLSNTEGSAVMLSSSEEFVENNKSFFDAHPEINREFTDKIFYGPMAYDQTVGRYPDGGNTYYLMNHPTISKANTLQLADIFVGNDTPAPKAVYGDVNADGSVDVSDINAIIAVICGESNNPQADVNADGATDVSDINAVIAIICGSPN